MYTGICHSKLLVALEESMNRHALFGLDLFILCELLHWIIFLPAADRSEGFDEGRELSPDLSLIKRGEV